MDGQTRRDVLKVAGVAGTAALLSGGAYHVYAAHAVPFARFFSHLSHPAPGRGSSGVHESGFSRFDPQTLSLPVRDGLLPTLTIVDDTLTAHRGEMTAVIREARRRAGG
jgi:hypothetical protein